MIEGCTRNGRSRRKNEKQEIYKSQNVFIIKKIKNIVKVN